MAKNQNKEPTMGEKRFVQNVLLQNEEPLYLKWVTKRKRDKVQDRLIVVGSYRIFSIKRTITGKKKIQRVGHLFDLETIYSADIDRVVLKFRNFDIDIQEHTAGTDLIHIIRKAIQKISYSFPDYALPKIVLIPQERTLAPLPSIDPGPANGFLETYKAWCDYYKSPPNLEFQKYIRDLVEKKSHDMNMNECPGFERKIDPIDFVPIRATLRHSTYFVSFCMKNIYRKEVPLLLADTFIHNVTITKLQISGTDANEQAFIALGAALKKNEYHNIVELDGAIGLAEGLQSCKHSLTSFNIACCGLTSKGISAIIQAFSMGLEVAKYLTELDMSHNSISQNGSISLSNWFNKIGIVRLKKLYLSNTKLDVVNVCKALKTGLVSSLEEFDISNNKIDGLAGHAVSGVVESQNNLTYLNLSNCEMNASPLVSILSAFIRNSKLKDVILDVSSNELGPQGAQNIGQCLSSSPSFGSLIARGCSFKKDGLFKIVESLTKNTSLKMLDLSLNFRAGKSPKMGKLILSFTDAISKHPTLEHLSISGDGQKFYIGKDLQPIIKLLSDNPTLTELDISGNKIGDQQAVLLCDSLKLNNKLKSLFWDNNNISIGGWQALLNVLGTNRTLCNCPTPSHDIDKAIRESKNKEQFKERVQEVMNKIQDLSKQNNNGISYTSVYLKKKETRIYSSLPSLAESRPISMMYNQTPQQDISIQNLEYKLEQLIPITNNNTPNGNNEPEGDELPPPPNYETITSSNSNKTLESIPAYNYQQEYASQEFDTSQYEEENLAIPPPPPPPF